MSINTLNFTQAIQTQKNEIDESSDESFKISIAACNILNPPYSLESSAKPSPTKFGYIDDDDEGGDISEQTNQIVLTHIACEAAPLTHTKKSALLGYIDNASNETAAPQTSKQKFPLLGYIDDAADDETEAVNASPIADPQPIETTPSIIFTPAQMSLVRTLSAELQKKAAIPMEEADPLAQAAIANLYLDPNQNTFSRGTKYKNGICMGFAAKSPHIFFHEKLLLGLGHIKVTFSAFVYNLKTEEIIPVVHQKLKKRTELIVVMTLREARLQTQLAHPNIVEIYAFNAYGVATDIKMAIYAERCDYDLKNAILKNQLDFSEKKDVAIDVAEALAFLHFEGYSHNDVKPDNILLKGKRGKLSDFGLCYSNDAKDVFTGFPKIQPPEQKACKSQFPSTQTDIYQFGLTLWHLFHPNPPSNHLDDKYQYPTDMFKDWPCQSPRDRALQALIQSCLEKTPTLRPSMAHVKTVLQSL